MCDIMDDLHAYVPSHTPNTDQQQSSEDKIQLVHPILLGGDQLTVARVRSAQKLRCNEFTPADRLEGLIPFSQDWHSFVACLEVSANYVHVCRDNIYWHFDVEIISTVT